MKLHLIVVLAVWATAVFAQNNNENPPAPTTLGERYKVPDGTPFAKTITAAEMKKMIDTLAGPTFEGRETGEEGQRRAAEYIAGKFKEMKLPKKGDRNTYFQQIALVNESWENLLLKINEQEFKNRTDFYVYTSSCPDVENVPLKDLVFVGYGIEDPKYNDYADTEVAGKAVVFYDGEPMNAEGDKSLITGTQFRSPWSLDWRKKVKLAKQKGASMVFIIDPKLAENVQSNRRLLSTWGWQPMQLSEGREIEDKSFVPHIFITPAVFEAMSGKKNEKVAEALEDLRAGKKFKPVKLKTKGEAHFKKAKKTLEGSNVIGFIEGTDPNLKNQFVVITAHYDHLGMSDSTRIYYGADDNASGTAGVIEIAQAFTEAKKAGLGPRRSVVCMLVSGEEKGLLGSKFYTEFPVFPLHSTVVNVNIDMIGRVDKRHASNPDYIYVIGGDRTSIELHSITDTLNKQFTKLELDYTYNAPSDPNRYFERSDHYNFVKKGIPAVFFFNGTHDDYHKPSDTADKINPEAAAKRAQLAFYVAWQIANQPLILSKEIKAEGNKN